MNRQQIQDAFDPICPDQAAKERMLRKILSQASDSQTAGKDVPMKKFKKRRPVLAAAMIALALLLVGCAAVVVMKLSDFEIGAYTQEERAWINARGEKIPAKAVTRNVLSLQGIEGSNNQLAAKEWYEFEEKYIAEHADEINDSFIAPREYDAYSVYTPAMKDKIDEIAQKYGLKLAGQGEIIQEWQSDVFCEALGIDGLLVKNAPVQIVNKGTGTFYACGNFRIHVGYNVTDPQFLWDRTVLVNMEYRDKDYLDTITVHIKEDTVEEQWIQVLEDGTEVLVFLFGDDDIGHHAYIFCDREDAFITVRMGRSYFDENGIVDTMGKQDVERFVNMIDFSIKPRKPNMEEIVPKLEAADKAYQAEMEARMAELGDPFRKDSYAEVAAEIGLTEFALADLDGDGIEECLFSGPDGWEQLYTMKEGKTEPINVQGDVFFCENGVVETYEEVGMSAYLIHGYYKVEEGKLVVLDRIIYDFANEEWARSNDGIHAEEVISKEDAEKIIASYVRLDVQMHPVSELQK